MIPKWKGVPMTRTRGVSCEWEARDGTRHVYVWRDGTRWGGKVSPRAQAGASIVRITGWRSARAVIDALQVALDVYDWRPPKPNPHPRGTCKHWERYTTTGVLGGCRGMTPFRARRETEGADCDAWEPKP